MAPTEASILGNFLLPPASFPSIISLKKFTDLFPRALQSHPHVKLLYRELQHQRALQIDEVKKSIAAEVRRGEKQRREVVRSRKQFEQESFATENELDIRIEREMNGMLAKFPAKEPQGLPELIESMEKACQDMQAENDELDSEANLLLSDIRNVVDNLSDLRYGKFNKPGAEETVGAEVFSGLEQLVHLSS
ncbi:hypothetical protein L228DRAFT_270693 [Xylona heveae TC161]|uniref:Cnl2/NKP2 family protein-domain-containing protein n=1 Tax=Xylona heveae (strain CBS 132557 / TC161) TaxID=1328760 RepID=A0A165A455_XYLHT|nr:hypothetical protein L228DRAFT_270693 [Xylona heveae TC161]KZF19926.1 hypothetical protein L228DRAFT_270693 [Xylona heveae TC161]